VKVIRQAERPEDCEWPWLDDQISSILRKSVETIFGVLAFVEIFLSVGNNE
jgi:hypothetical protein